MVRANVPKLYAEFQRGSQPFGAAEALLRSRFKLQATHLPMVFLSMAQNLQFPSVETC